MRVQRGVAAGWRVATMADGKQVRLTSRELYTWLNSGAWELTEQAAANLISIRDEIRRENRSK